MLPIKLFHTIRYRRLGVRLGFTIGINTLGYGAIIPHYGTIVVGTSNRLGNYPVLHTSTCITDNGIDIGDALYLSTGSIITSKLLLGDNVSIGANSLVNKSYESNMLLVGSPAIKKRESEAWYIRDGEKFRARVQKIETIKKHLNL